MDRLFVGLLACVSAVVACGSTIVVDGTGSTNSTSTSGSGASQATTSSVSSSGFGGSQTTTTTTDVSSSGFGGAGTTTTTTGTGGMGGAPVPVACPSAPPTANENCTGYPVNYRCTYGDAVNPECRTQWTCNTLGTWVSAPNPCETTPPSQCPSSEPGSNVICGSETRTCVYGDDICSCGCGGGLCTAPPYSWSCAPPPPAPCPSLAPNSGTACPISGTSCVYGDPCNGGAEVQCTDAFWIWQNVVCAVAGLKRE